ncbi:MAG: dihydrolipoyl dehydrogenase [Alphaproteobacteria bacterium]
MEKLNFDLVIMGAGPGGYVSAIRAGQLGLNVAVVEANHLGGICLNWGCIPAKALLRSSEVYRQMKHAEEYGLSCKAEFNLEKIIARSRGVSERLSGGVAHLLKKNKVTVIDGFAKLSGGTNGARVVSVSKDGTDTHELTAKNVIIATGARARILDGLEPDGKFIWSYKEALVADVMPKDLVVLGSGAIGIEFASFFNELGANVTVVEVQDRILPVEDADISAMAKKSFEKQGMKIITGTGIKSVDKNKDDMNITLDNGDVIKADKLITAVGIVGNVENIGLEDTKIKVEKTHIIVDKWAETDEKGIYAIGDIAGAPWLAHKAEHEGVIAVEKIAGLADVHPLNKAQIPGATYCHPQIASVGLTEAQAKEQGLEVNVGKFPFMANGKAIALGEDEGLVKTVFDKTTGELLGAHMIGAEVTEMIGTFSVAQKLETTEVELMHTVFPHPTLSEMLHESVLDAYNRAIHI